MTGDKEIDSILKEIDKGVIDFQEGIPAIQQRIYSKLLMFQKELIVTNGTIVNSAKNIRLLSKLKGEIEYIIYEDTDYLEMVESFAKLYSKIDTLNGAYFKALEKKFKPSKVVEAIRKQSIGLVLESLTERI